MFINILAKSDNRFMARRLAVRDMYNSVAQTKYPEMQLAIGGQCVGLQRLKEMGIRPLMSATVRNRYMYLSYNMLLNKPLYN